MSTVERRGSAFTKIIVRDDKPCGSGTTYECRTLLCPEAEGGFSAHAIYLPGVVTQGETEEEALAMMADAFREAVLSYRAEQMPIPWQDEPIVQRTAGSKERWILVNV